MFECVRYSPINKSSCLGVATVFIPKWNVELSGVSLHQKEGKRWVNLPARVVEENGEKKYYPYVKFRERENKDKFCEKIKDAIDVYILKQETAEIEKMPEINDDEIPF